MSEPAPVLMDGHVHVTNRIYWEHIDPWVPHDGGWDFARARGAGVNCIIENVGTYGYWNYNYSPKQTLRLIETFHRFAESHADRMAVALSVRDARTIIASGRMAVFLGCESGFDHEGDPDVLGAFYRLGLRAVQFATQTGFNSLADSAMAPDQGGEAADHFHGISDRGRQLVKEMNRLGVLIDITHATETAQLQLIRESHAPVVASHEALRSVSGAGISDAVVVALAAKGGLVGIKGDSASIGRRYRQWMHASPNRIAELTQLNRDMVGYKPAFPRLPGDRGEFIERMDREFAGRWRARLDWREPPEAVALVPTADEWAEHVNHVIGLVGAEHVAIGLDMVGGRSGVPANAGGYGELVAALGRITTPRNVRLIAGENWFRVLEASKSP